MYSEDGCHEYSGILRVDRYSKYRYSEDGCREYICTCILRVGTVSTVLVQR